MGGAFQPPSKGRGCELDPVKCCVWSAARFANVSAESRESTRTRIDNSSAWGRPRKPVDANPISSTCPHFPLGDCRLNCLTPTPTAWTRRGITTYIRAHADGVAVNRILRQSPCLVNVSLGKADLRRFAQSVAEDVEHQWVQTEWRTEVEADTRPLLGELSAKAAEVFRDVCAG